MYTCSNNMKMKMKSSFLFLLSVFLSVQALKSPIVIVPGLLGSQLEAKLDKHSSPNLLCSKKSDWFILWVELESAIPGVDECFVDNVKLRYDENTKEYYNASGVEVRVPGFGGTDTIEYLDKSYAASYFNTFVKYFEGIGYKKGLDLNGAPYDWRFAPDGLSKLGYYDALHQLIEDSYNRNGHTPVTLIGHSLGGPTSLYFLTNHASPDWKATRIKQFISLSGAFGGSAKIFLGLISGEKRFTSTGRSLVTRYATRTFPSYPFLLPSYQLWESDEVLVTQPKRNYTVHNYEELFTDIKDPNGTRMYNEVKNLVSSFPPPNVTHYCFYGTDVPTVAQIIYDSFPDQLPSKLLHGNGDGTVNARSLESCRLWKDKQVFPVVMKSFSNVTHGEMVTDKNVLEEIEKLL